MSNRYTKMFTRYAGRMPLLSEVLASTFRSSFSSSSSSYSLAPAVLPWQNMAAAVFICRIVL